VWPKRFIYRPPHDQGPPLQPGRRPGPIRGVGGKRNEAATQFDPLDRDGRMLDNLARNSSEFCFCRKQPQQTNAEQGSAKRSGSLMNLERIAPGPSGSLIADSAAPRPANV
jgi:hypothetical protein